MDTDLFSRENSPVLVERFFKNSEPHEIRECDLGWQNRNAIEAHSSIDSVIFDYYVVQVGLNMLFYYIEDGQFYSIETEKEPAIEVRRLYRDPQWDGQYLIWSVKDCAQTNSPGEILYTINCRSQIRDIVKINGKNLVEVLRRSVIVEMD